MWRRGGFPSTGRRRHLTPNEHYATRQAVKNVLFAVLWLVIGLLVIAAMVAAPDVLIWLTSKPHR